MAPLVRLLWKDESGQDLVEYALLATFIGLIGAAAFTAINQAIHDVYQSWNNSGAGVNGQWETPDPIPSGS